ALGAGGRGGRGGGGGGMAGGGGAGGRRGGGRRGGRRRVFFPPAPTPPPLQLRRGGQRGRVPPAAERAHELHAGQQAAALHGDRGAFVRERGGLHDDHLEVADRAGAVLVLGEVDRFARRPHRGVLDVRLLREDLQRREVV